MDQKTDGRHMMAVDCCEHILKALEDIPSLRVTSLDSNHEARINTVEGEIHLIVIGVSQYPVRRLFITQLRRICPDVPLLILRREESIQPDVEDRIRGEFILSDTSHLDDFETVRSLRGVLPFKPCKHIHRGENFDTVREVVRVIAEKYSDPDLDLARVAKEVPMSPVNLSKILNQQVGVSFRQLLRQVRIEEAKRMLASRRYSVKQVASQVGFSDTHYFSRSFRELTGLSASEFRAKDSLFG
jgi:AraC-like DNA-binding protein